MNGNDKNIISYSASDLERYLNGALSDAEMHALERAALDDPFLADALEGMDIHRRLPDSQPFAEDLQEIRGRLAERIDTTSAPKVIKPFFRRPWVVAAALIGLLGSGTIAYLGLTTGSAKYNLDQIPAPVAASTPPASPSAMDTVSIAHTETETAATDSSASGAVAALPRPAYKAKARIAQPKKDSSTYAMGYLRLPDSNHSLAKDHSLATNRSLASNAPAAAASPLFLTGKVIDQNKHPLPGVSIFVNGSEDLATITDKQGNFQFKAPGRDTTFKVMAASTGYELGSLELSTDNRTANIIQLQPQTSTLNEVVVSGYGSKRKETMRRNIDAPQKPLSLVAIPADGWPSYIAYLESNKRSPALDSSLAGIETISFMVSRSGKLSSFKVEQSISPAHDSISTHLIKNGPGWHLMNGRRARAIVHITYP